MYLCIEIVLNSTYKMDSRIFSIIYITLFIVLSVALNVVIIPSKQEYNDYKKSRRILGFGFFLIASSIIIRLLCFPPTQEVGFRGFFAIASLSLVFNTLNFISFLYMIETSRPKRKMLKKISIASLIAILGLGAAGMAFPSIQSAAKICMEIVYVSISTVLFTGSIREYDKFILQMDNFYEDELNIKWIPGMLWATFILAISMTTSFHFKTASLFTGISSVLIYTIVSMKMLSFLPENIHVVRRNIQNHEIIAEDHGEHIHIFPIDGPMLSEESGEEKVQVKEKDGTDAKNRRLQGLIDKYLLLEHYTTSDINIKEVAKEMGTNSSYLSTYLNKELNISFSMWLNTLRIEKSKEYLCSEEKMSIEECGIKVGYTSLYNYSRWFKVITGVSPSQYRKTHGIAAASAKE